MIPITKLHSNASTIVRLSRIGRGTWTKSASSRHQIPGRGLAVTMKVLACPGKTQPLGLKRAPNCDELNPPPIRMFGFLSSLQTMYSLSIELIDVMEYY